MLAAHLKLGPDKAISYLPIKTIEKVIDISIQTYISMIETSGNRYLVFSPADCCIDSGAIYAYRFDVLEELLNNNRTVLGEHGWPTDPDSFIRRIASDWLDQEDPIMPIVRKAFGDFT